MSFSANVSAFAKETKSSVDEAVRTIKIELFSSVILDTRVDTGRLRGNWQTTTGSPADGEIDRLDPLGSGATREVRQGVKPDTVDYLTNNLPYAEVWEDKDGMVAKNVARITQIVRRYGAK
jgi:hypothetical protein